MDIFLLIVAGLLMLIGVIGCIVPGLPGTPIAYAGLWIAQATKRVDFSWKFLLIWGLSRLLFFGTIIKLVACGLMMSALIQAIW